jgi:hypothetical protein
MNLSDNTSNRVSNYNSENFPDDERRCYVELAKLGVRIATLKDSNPTLKQLSQLSNGLKRLTDRHNTRYKGLRLQDIEAHDHLFAVFPDVKTKLDGAFHFLEEGIHKSEAVMMITDEMTKREMLDRMSIDWHVDAYYLERNGDITVKGVKEWYFPDGTLRIDRIVANWMTVTNLAISKGKSGLRVFGDASPFFKNGFTKELVEYESALDVKFIALPLTALCGYSDDDVEMLSASQIESLQQHHKLIR